MRATCEKQCRLQVAQILNKTSEQQYLIQYTYSNMSNSWPAAGSVTKFMPFSWKISDLKLAPN